MDHIDNISERNEGKTDLSETSVTIGQNLSRNKDVENITNTETKEAAAEEGPKNQIDSGPNEMDLDISVIENSITEDHDGDNLDKTQSSNDTSMEFSSIEINKKHGLVKPDVMIEIPTQELINFTDDSECNSHNTTAEKEDIDDLALDAIETEKSAVIENVNQTSESALDTIETEKAVVIENVSEISESCKNIENETNTIVNSSEHTDAMSVEENVDAISTEENTKLFPEELNKESIECHTEITDTPLLEKSTDLDTNKVTISEPNESIKSESELVANDKISTEIEKFLEPKQAEVENKQTISVEIQPSASQDSDDETCNSKNSKPEFVKYGDDIVIENPKVIESKQIDNKPVENLEIEVSTSNQGVLSKSEFKEVEDVNVTEIPESENSYSQLNLAESENKPSESIEEARNIESQPSTSRCSDDTSSDARDEVPEVTDSLGLLAESSRVVEDDEDPDQEVDEDEDQEDDEDDQDDEFTESNQTTAEHSEDSNAQHSETDQKENSEMETDGQEAQDGQQFAKITSPLPKETETTFGIEISNVISALHQEKSDGSDERQKSSEATVEEQNQNVDVDVTNLAEDNLASVNEKQPEETKEPKQSMDIETVKLSDNSDNETEVERKTGEGSLLKDLLVTPAEEKTKSEAASSAKEQETMKESLKKKKLEIAKQRHVVNIVDLGESSSEDDVQVQETEKPPSPDMEAVEGTSLKIDEVTSVNIPNEIEIICTAVRGNPSEIVTREREIVISGVPKPPPQKPARLNTGEVTIKTASVASESTLVIPETKMDDQAKPKPKFSLEIFSLDSDEEDGSVKAVDDSTPSSPKDATQVETKKKRKQKKCINASCKSSSDVPCFMADSTTVAFYDASRKRRPMVCRTCAEVVANKAKALIDGMKNFTPLLDLHLDKVSQELVEISDSESEDEREAGEQVKEIIGEKVANFLEAELADAFNKTWKKYKMDERLKQTEDALMEELHRYEEEGKEIEKLLDECQVATDELRNNLYATFEGERKEMSAIVIYDAHDFIYSCLETEEQLVDPRMSCENRQLKRKISTSPETPSKRQAIPLGYAPLDTEKKKQDDQPASNLDDNSSKLDDDNVDISVVKLSAESAPAGLPPPGEIKLPPLRVGMTVYAMRNSFGAWVRAKIIEIQPKVSNQQFTMCRVKFEHRVVKNTTKLLPARCLAYSEPADVRMTIGTRVIALFKDSTNNSTRQSYYSGIVAEIPNPVNDYRYLVFFDDGYAQYVQHPHTMLVCECSALVWEEVHPFSRQFVREYLLAYPERPMVRLHAGQKIKTELNGRWLVSNVVQVDASLVQVNFEHCSRKEWIYRGSTRLAPLYLELQAAERHRARPMPRSTGNKRLNMPYVEYTRPDEQTSPGKTSDVQSQQHQNEELRRQRAVAKKSTAAAQPPPPPQTNSLDQVTSRVVYYTPKSAVKPYKMVPHTCSPKCKRNDVLALKDLRTYNPLAKPLLSGWERQIVRYRGHKEVMYRAPCGRRLRNMPELHRYLSAVHSDMAVDLFDFGPNMHCLAEFVLNRCIVSKKDLSHGKENVPVPCVNYYDDSLPEFCSYNTERTPTAGVPLNLDPEFLCGCDCTDDCQDKSKCACWQMTLEGARTIGLEGEDIGYVYRRLPEPLPSGIYECNSRCKCRQTCLNRVAQHPLQLKLQVFKTLTRGWGIRALNDVPKGSFLCVYAGNLLTDATANLDGLNEGDEYLAELDYIEVVEQMKEGYEDDIPEADKKLDKKESGKKDDEPDESSSSDEDESGSKHDKEDCDFKPSIYDTLDEPTTFNKKLRRRDKNKKKDSDKESTDDDTITISDDEEVREPSRFAAQAGMGANEFVSKYRSVRSHFGKDEACYIVDAKVQGNIGRYLNHSCSPNVFVQNVFVDTHDPRFPWVAFFALSHIRAGTELTWNYNYDIGSVPGKVLYCYCGSANCRGRLL